MTAIAIDDEPIALQVIRAHAARVPFLDLQACFTDALQALQYLQEHPTDLIFLDIKMPDISGIELYNSLPARPLLVFTTAYAEHAPTGFELDAVDYLLKPFSLARFVKACSKARELFLFRNMAARQQYFFLKSGYEQVKIQLEDILYLEAAGNYVSFVLKDRTVLSRLTTTEAIGLLPEDRFIRVHRSFVVALPHITRAERTGVTVGGRLIPVSEAYAGMLEQALRKAGRGNAGLTGSS